MYGHKRRGACRVDRHAGAAQVEVVRQTVGGNAEGQAGTAVGIDQFRRVGLAELLKTIVCGTDPNEYAAATARQMLGREASILKRLPGNLQQQALLGVHGLGLVGGDAKELRVEVFNCGEKATLDA